MVSLMSLRKAFLGVLLCGGALFLFLYMNHQLPSSTLSSPNESKEKPWDASERTEFSPSESKTKPRYFSEGTEFPSNEAKEKPWHFSQETEFPPSESKTKPGYLFEGIEFPSNEAKEKPWHVSQETEFLPSESKTNHQYLSEGTEPKKKPWYFFGGTEFPKAFKGTPKLFPEQAEGDRITDQLMYVPEDYKGFDTPEKIILEYNGEGRSDTFHGCPVNRCSLIGDMNKLRDADAILFYDQSMHYNVARRAKQVWILYMLECPYNTRGHNDIFNWTATYRQDSDIVTPYERWTYYDSQVRQKSQMRNYAANKTKKVAWFVSNCLRSRNGRLEYGHELNKYIPVDIYGLCGPLECAKENPRCFELLDRDYKFYLAFENSNCREYITEKFYVNSLNHSVLPIVMGARPEDYERSAPQWSYIHVDDFGSAEELAAYLHRLDKDDDLYNSYFRWKGTGEFINTYFWCRLCAMLHAPASPRHYENIGFWWGNPDDPAVCTNSSWRKTST